MGNTWNCVPGPVAVTSQELPLPPARALLGMMGTEQLKVNKNTSTAWAHRAYKGCGVKNVTLSDQGCVCVRNSKHQGRR